MNDLLKALMSPAPLTEELRENLQRVERALDDITLEEFFSIMMGYHLEKMAESTMGIVAQRITEAKQAQAAVIAKLGEGIGSTPFDGPEDEDEEDDDFSDEYDLSDDEDDVCSYCEGECEIECKTCHGDQVTGNGRQCVGCRGRGTRNCPECGGTGTE